jgi:hypothetical protein
MADTRLAHTAGSLHCQEAMPIPTLMLGLPNVSHARSRGVVYQQTKFRGMGHQARNYRTAHLTLPDDMTVLPDRLRPVWAAGWPPARQFWLAWPWQYSHPVTVGHCNSPQGVD